MAYADIPVANKPAFDACVLQARSSAGAFARFLSANKRFLLSAAGADVTAAIAALTNATDTVDTPTGLAGVGVITRAQLQGLFTAFQSIDTTYGTNANITTLITFAGLPNTQG